MADSTFGKFVEVREFLASYESMSVLHFTRRPLGHICVAEPAECFS